MQKKIIKIIDKNDDKLFIEKKKDARAIRKKQPRNENNKNVKPFIHYFY